jgi:DNA invertase Pin-like site-specific DNA recombinase
MFRTTNAAILVPDRYDDGGFSGGTLDRPALKRLLTDIEAGKVDVVVVYKIDRQSRSLMDFSRLVEVFDQHKVTFVSVTQSFNTTTSMGRLTLNILLSFAQFEREVIGERIRDKFAASRKRGMWMGGWAPLGYEVKDRKLIVNDVDARLVRSIFQRFLKVGSATTLARQLIAESNAKMVQLEGRKAELEQQLTDAEAPPPLLHPEMATFYREQVGALHEALHDDTEATRLKAGEILRSLVKEIILTPEAGELKIDVRGDLAGILAISLKTKTPATGTGVSQFEMVAGTCNHLELLFSQSLIQFLAQFRIELVPVDRLIERDGSAFSLEIRKDDGRPRIRGLARIVAEVRHDLASSDHIPSATSRCGLRSRSELIQYPAQIFAHFFLSVPAEVFSRRLSRLSILMMNVQLQSGIVHLDLGHPYRRSALAKIVSHPDVAGQKSVLSDGSCRGDCGKGPGVLFSRSSIGRHRGDGGAEKRRGKHDWKRGVHECAANVVLLKRTGRSVGSAARPGRSGTEGPENRAVAPRELFPQHSLV